MLDVNLRYQRGGRAHHHRFTVPARQTVWLSGESGIGKSSLLLALAGLIPSSDGDYVRFQGQELTVLATAQRPLVLMPQGDSLLAHLSVWQNVAIGHVQGWRFSNTDQQQAQYWLEQLQLDNLGKKYPAHISGGQAQRVMLARCLFQMRATGRKLLLLDEISSALDNETRTHVCQVIQRAQQVGNWTVLWVAHHEVPHDLHWPICLGEDHRVQVLSPQKGTCEDDV